MAKNYFGITDTGKQRTNNEDTFIADKLNRQFITACVIDGLGGYEGGEIAAAITKDTIIKALSKNTGDVFGQMKQAVINAGNNIQEAKKIKNNENNNQMACVVTLALADIDNNKFYYAHVGDTRLYLLRDKSLIKITKDQSFVGFLEDNGRLTEEEAMQHPKRNEINKALGFDTAIDADDYIETGDSPFLPGDLIMLCSDGLTDMINSSTMTAILTGYKTLQQKAEALVNAANNAGGNDNITVVLVHNDKQQIQQTAIKPAGQKKSTEIFTETNNDTRNFDVPLVPESHKKSTIAIPVLSILLLLALVALGWLFMQTRDKESVAAVVNATPVLIKKRNVAEQALMDSINKPLQQSVFITTDSSSQPIVISDTIFINKDSLIIHGNGAIIVSDSSFKGPAFVLSDNCDYVVFDSLTFKNFDAAIWAQQTGIHLNKIRFINCPVPVMQQFDFPDGIPMKGNIPGNLFTTDSLRK
ncbi:hypothetical protein BH10BAC3_BH10BAC3_06790 [soil metagenome]